MYRALRRKYYLCPMESYTTLKELLAKRRSIFPKDYTGGDIAPEHLVEILRSGSLTPQHKKTMPHDLRLFTGEEKDAMGVTLAQIYKATTPPEQFLEKKYLDISSKWSRSSAVVVLVVRYSGLVPRWEETAAVAMGVQNMHLLCTSLGLGCYWGTPGLKDRLTAHLSLSENQECLGFFFIGTLN